MIQKPFWEEKTMKSIIIGMTIVMSLVYLPGSALPASEVEQMKSDLMGQNMGGREKGWKFQSPDQIKELVIIDKKEDAQKRVYDVTMKLQDPRSPGMYQAEAVVTYEKVDSAWKVKVVGLKSMMKIQ